jgi:hypothetical protein
LIKYGISFNVRKFVIYVIRDVFLGFMISINGVTADSSKVAAIRDKLMPGTTTEVRTFVNAAGYFRYLIKGYAKKSGPLTDLTGGPKGQPVTLFAEAQTAWREIRDLITDLPILKPFDWCLPVVLETDASLKYIGAALLQPYMFGNRLILYSAGYYSKKLDETQIRYAFQERELLAIVLVLRYWRHWVEGDNVTMITDHEFLKGLNTKAEQPVRIMRFLDIIEHYKIRIIYRPGKANMLADYLSRPPEIAHPAEEGEEQPNAENPGNPAIANMLVKRLKQLTRNNLQAIYQFLAINEPLPLIIKAKWVHKHFIKHADSLYKIQNCSRDPGDPPHAGGMANKATILLQIPEFQELNHLAKLVHHEFGHATAGKIQRQFSLRYWHPEMTLAVQ